MPVHMVHVNKMRGATGMVLWTETMSQEPCLKDVRVWSLQKANGLRGTEQESGFLACSRKVQLQQFGGPQGIEQAPKVMMTGNAISAQHKNKKCLSRQNYPRVEQTAFEGGEIIVIGVFKYRLHSYLVGSYLV